MIINKYTGNILKKLLSRMNRSKAEKKRGSKYESGSGLALL